MDQLALPSSSCPPQEQRRSVKRRPPPAGSPEPSPRAGAGPAELLRRVEELEAEARRLAMEKEAAEESALGLQGELEAERASAETAASEAMLMIERLQREKAAAQMEARQFRRYAEGRADHEREVQEELASLSDLAASYHSRLQSHGIDPDTFSDEEDEELYEEQRGHADQIDLVAPEAEGDGADLLIASANGMEVKAMVEEQEQEQSTTPVEKEFEYTVDVRCASPTMAAVAVVGEYVGDVAGNAGGLYARVEALEADRTAMHREIAALRAERAQLVMAREMARRLCWEVVSEKKSIAKQVLSRPRDSRRWEFASLVFHNIATVLILEKLTTFDIFAAVVALRDILEKKLYYQVYVRLVNYVPWPPAAPRQIDHVESMAASA
ncbi:hypothetical protein ZWY2020_018005 [Hordeum vulgare]|nr:hypothetical protein ZWY2020_018005 [Hordeum vulgare]